MKKMNKKAQLTVFIIVGIVLLFSAALIIYIRGAITAYKPPVEIAAEQVPTEMQPLQRYITDCIEITAKDALRKAGMQGGYVDASSIIINEEVPTSGEGIRFFEGSDLVVPYWYYMRSPNTCEEKCEFSSKRPELYRSVIKGNSVEEQIDMYIEQKLASCLGDFAPFKEQGFEIEQSSIKALTTVAKTSIFVVVDYPIKVKKDGRISELSRFPVQIQLNLGKLYDLAAALAKKEEKSYYLTMFAMNLIDIYSGIDEKRLPPIADTGFGAGSKVTWMNREVKTTIQQLLMTYSSALRAVGTTNFFGNFYDGDDSLAKGLYSMFILPMNYTYGADAEFTYLSSWPVYLKITPSAGELIKPESVGNFAAILSSFGFSQYKFAYDLSYPVIITLSDSDALDGEGYVFQFALESNTRNNKYMTSETSLISYSGRPRTTLACEPENFNSGNITIEVRDSITKTPVESAVVYFSFGREACLIGETEIVSAAQANNNEITGAAVADAERKAVLNSKMPVGIGSLIISKEGYISKTIPYGTRLDKKDSIVIELDRYIELDASVVRMPVAKKCSSKITAITGPTVFATQDLDKEKCFWFTEPPLPNLESTQEAAVSLIRIPENPAQEEFAASFIIKGNEARTKKITLVPGKYQVSGTLINNQKTIIPEDRVCYPDDWYDTFGFGKEKCETIPAVEFDEFSQGGASIEEFIVIPEDLSAAKEILIKIIEVPSGYTRNPNGITNMKHTDLEVLNEIDDYSKNNYEAVKPVFR